MKTSSVLNAKAVDQLCRVIHSKSGLYRHLRPDEPDWNKLVDPLELPREKTEELVTGLKRLWLLPFANFPATAGLLLFQYGELPGIARRSAQKNDCPETKLCALFELLVAMVLQGFSAFPQNPAHLAEQVRDALRHPRRSRDHLLPLLGLLIDRDTGMPDSGFNTVRLEDPGFVLAAEHNRRAGLNEQAWKTPFKYAEFERRVRESPRFRADWESLRRCFRVSKFRDADGIIRRTRIEEGSWRHPITSDLSPEKRRFQIAFDFFCWKWFLYGMKGDEPMVQKLAYSMTPFGTMLFIPAYWSFDPKRDLNWDIILRLHRARGIGRQGPKLSAGHDAHEARLNALLLAEDLAKKRGLRGEARYSFLKKAAGLIERTDNAQVRRMLRKARRLRPGTR